MTLAPRPDRSMAGDFVLHREQPAADVDIADLMVMLDRLLSGRQAEPALGAGVVERDVQCPEDADGIFHERDDVILPADVSVHEQGEILANGFFKSQCL